MPHIRKAIALFAALVLGHAWAAAQAAPTGFESCGQVSDDKERLACFDRELALQKERKQTVAPASAAAPAPAGAGPAAAQAWPSTSAANNAMALRMCGTA